MRIRRTRINLENLSNAQLQDIVDNYRGAHEDSEAGQIQKNDRKLAQNILDERIKPKNKAKDRFWQVLIGILLLLIGYILGKI